MAHITVHRGRRCVVPVTFQYDISGQAFTSHIRVGIHPQSLLIAVWDIEFKTDGTDGKLIMSLDETVTANITQNIGFTDIKRVSGGDPYPAIDTPLHVYFVNVVTP